MSKRIYIAGKVTGLEWDSVVTKFGRAQEEVLELVPGGSVFNPVVYVQENFLEQESWEEIMKRCLKAMMDCDLVVMLPCWKESRGAVLERDIAVRLGMEVVYR